MPHRTPRSTGARVPSQVPPNRHAPTRATVLLVEPDQAELDRLAAVLRVHFRLFVARTTAQAVAVADEIGWRPQALLIDFEGAPIRDSVRLIRLLRWRQKRLPVVALHRGPDEQRIRRAAEPDALIKTPADPHELARRITALIAKADDGAD